MTYYDIYLSALAYIGEPEDSTGAADYKKRSLLLLPHIVSSLLFVHQLISERSISAPELSEIFLDSEFPLENSLAAVASAELASLLIIDELPTVSKELGERAAKERERILTKASSIGSTREVY